METTPLEADYLVVGAGAAGMAFADTLLAETDARIVMVDRQHRPGGHWNAAPARDTLPALGTTTCSTAVVQHTTVQTVQISFPPPL